MDFVRQPYVFSLVLSVLTAAIAYGYSLISGADSDQCRRTFFKTMAAGTIAGLALTYLTRPRMEPIAMEPFDAMSGAPPGI